MKLRAKAVLLFTLMTLGPVAIAIALLVDANRRPVKTSEQMLQSAVLAEVAASPARLLRDIENDTLAVAAILQQAVEGRVKDEDAEGAVRGLVAGRSAVDAVRFEVPAARISTLFRRGPSAADVPPSTPELRKLADEREVAFALVGPGKGLVIARVRSAKPDIPPGYVVANAALDRLADELRGIAERRFGGDVSLLIATQDRVAVASFGVAGAAPGASVAALPIWRSLPEGTPWSQRVGVVTEHVDGGTTMVGALETVPDLGWAVAIWRPEPVAYASLADMRRRGLLVAAAAALLAIAVGVFAARGVTGPVLKLVGKTRLIGQHKWREVAEPEGRRGDEIGELDRSLHQMALDLEHGEQEAKLRGDLSRFMSKQLVDAIVRGDHSLALGGRRTQVSVLFADVVGFTPLAEARGAEQVVALLNELFSVLTEVVFRHGGTVDKFVGDCIMAVWGAPVAADDHAARALAAAEDMMRFLETANEGWKEKYDIEIRLGIGVNSGEAIVGNIGSDKRMEYTVIGDVVNVAARLEAIAQPNQVLVAGATQTLVGDEFALTRLGGRKLTGRKTDTEVYALDIE